MKVKYFSRIVDNVNTLTRVYIPAAVILLLFFYTGGSVFAQGISQVTITGIPPIISSPNISDLEGNFNNGMYSIQFTYTNSNPGQVPFVFHVVLEKDGKTLIDVKSDPKNYSPGTYLLSSLFNDLNFPYSFSDLLNQVGSALKQQVIQGGVIPEGNYTIKIEALPANAAQGVSAVPAIVNAQVIYPQPPILVTPADESNVIQNIPTFSWTPVVVPGGTSIEYDLLLVQVIDSQTPLQAINSNRAYAEVKLINQNTYSYTPDNLPLQKGQKYAWQITAKDANGIIPFKDDGRSEIYTFTYGKSENGNEQAGGIKNLKSITLVPGFAELINLKNLEAQDNDSYYSLNGYASLLFHLPGLSKSESTVQVNVNNLMLQKGSPGHPVLMGGQVSGDALPPLKIFEKFKGLVNVSGFQWNFGQGFTIESSFFDSDGNPLQAAGNLNLTAQGIRGHLNFSQPLTFSSSGKGSSVKYEAESIDFGKGTLSGSGSLWLNLGGRSFKCGTCGFTLNPEVQGNGPIFVINVNSGNTVSIPLVKGSKNLLLDLTNPHGKVSYNFTSKKFADDLNFVGLIKLHLMSGVTCCLTAGVGFNSQKGFSVKDAVPTCKITNPRIDLGAVKMELKKFSLSKLSYNTSDGKWDFKLNFDAVLDPAIFPGISLPEVKDITLTPGGFDFPSINFSESALSNLPAIFYPPQQGYYPPQQGYYPPQQGYYPPQQGAYPPQQGYYPPQQGSYPPQQGYYPPQQGYSGQQEFSSLEHPTVVNPFSTSLGLKSFDMKGFTFPWFNWERNNAGSWDFKLDLSMGFPKVNSGLLSCFNNKKINISGVRFSNGKMDINLNASRLKNCIMPLGEGSKIIVSKLGGDISFTYDKEVNVKSRLNFDGDLKLGEPFESGRKNIHISSGSLDIGKGGIIGGDIKNIDLNSMIKIGAYSVTLKRAELILGEKGGKQDALLKAAAELHLSGGRTVAGSASIDLMTGKIEKYEFQLDKPFQWKIPHDKPVMVFNVDKAKINQDGFFVDGRGSLNISGTKIPTVFDNLVLDPKTYEVKKGKIIINKDFAFEAGINEKTNGLSFKPVANGSGFDLNPGLFMALNGTIIIDTLGLHSSGSAGAKINFKSYKIDSLKAVYSNDFVLGLKPFGVKKGEADFYWKEQKVAYADPSGFHADFSYFGKKLLPDRLPLPVESFAYIQLRKNKKLLVNYKRQNDGTVKIFTKKNQPVDIVFPGLKGNTSAAPVIHTSFNNVVINPSTGQFISGKISADVSNSNPISDLSRFGIPLILKNVSFGKQVINGVSVPAMAMKGGFKLFNNKFGQNGNVTFYVQNDGRVKGNVSLKNISASVPLMANNLVALKIDSVDGSVDVPVISGGSPSIDLALGGEFRLLNTSGDNIAEAYISLRYDRNGLTLTHFSGAGNTSAAQFKLKGLGLEINKINNLTLGYNKNTGFDFDAGLDFKININTGKNKISIPLKNIDINKKLGIVIPDQDINQSTHPSFPENSTAFDIGIYHFQPFAMRIQSDTLNWNDLSANSAGNLLPKFDMQLSFPSLKNSSGELANATITLNNVGFGDGVFTGTVQPYTFRGNGALLSTGGGSGIYVKSISGGLLKNKDGSQGYNIKLSGSFKLPDYFVNKNGGCGNSVSVELSPDGGLTGSVSNFTPCGNIKLNSLVLTFRKSNLQFSIKGKNQEIVLAGKAAASLNRDNAKPLTAGGSISFDILNEKILSGTLSFNGKFNWNYPKQNPLFKFAVQSAELNKNGFVFTGSGSFKTNGTAVSVNFNNLAFGFKSEKITGGNVKILNSFAFDIGLSPLKWEVSNASTSFGLSNGLRLIVPKNLTIDKKGLTINSTSTAVLNYAGKSHSGLSAGFSKFLLGFNPLKVASGRADLDLKQQGKKTVRLAYYDDKGFHLDNLAGALPLPDTLGLPTKDIAFLVLRDGQGNSLVKSSSVSGGMSIKTTQPVKLVIAALQHNGTSPKVNVSFSNVVLNSSFQITGGKITADLTKQTPIDLSSYGFPLKIDTISYKSSSGSGYGLYAGVEFDLPVALNSVKAFMGSIKIGSGGFEQATVKAGDYTSRHTEGNANLVTQSFHNGAFIFKINGAEITFGNKNMFKISGDVESNLFKDHSGSYSAIHYTAGYTNSKWHFSAETSGLPRNGINLGYVKFKPSLIGFSTQNNSFGLNINGVFKAPDLLGPNFALTVKGLHIGTDNISVKKVSASGMQQHTKLFAGLVDLNVNNMNVTLLNNVLNLVLSGNMSVFNKTFTFNQLSIASDGHVSMASGGVDLLGKNNTVPILPDYLILDTLKIKVLNNHAELIAGAKAVLPPPLNATSRVHIAVTSSGHVTETGPVFDLKNNKHAEFDFPGGLGNVKLTEVGLDLKVYHWLQTELFVSADLNLRNHNANAKAGSSNKKFSTIQFGDDSGDPSKAGFSYSIRNGVNWLNVKAPSHFSFGIDEFYFDHLNLVNLDPKHNGFAGLQIGGDAHLNIPGVTGKISFSGLKVTSKGIESFGRFLGGHLELLNGEVKIDVGKFSYGSDTTLTLKVPNGDKKNPKAKTEKVDVTKYFLFTNTGNSDAVKISVADLGSGGLHKFIYYKTSGGMFLDIDHVNLTLDKTASLDVSLLYKKENSTYKLMVAGKGKYKSYGVDAMGEITNDPEFKLGVYVRITSPVPIIPSVIDLTKFGGGFFYHPDKSDFQFVMSTFTDSSGHALPWDEYAGSQDKTNFAVILNAGVGLIGSSGTYAYTGGAIVIATDNFFELDANVDYKAIKDVKGGTIKAGIYIQVDYFNGKKSFNAGGNLYVKLKKNIAHGTARIDFNAVSSGGSTNWQLEGGTDKFTILAATVSGHLLINNDGFYVDCSVGGNINIKNIVKVNGGVGIGLFYWKTANEFGAYASLKAKVTYKSIPLVGVKLQGALLTNDRETKLAFAGSVSALGQSVGVWAALTVSSGNSKWDAGFGSGDKLDKLIAKAKSESAKINSDMDNEKQALNIAMNNLSVPSINSAVITSAGYNLQMKTTKSWRDELGASILMNEKTVSAGNAAPVFGDIKYQVFEGNHPDFDLNNNSYKTDMKKALSDISGSAQSVLNKLKNLKTSAVQIESQTNTSVKQIFSPITKKPNWAKKGQNVWLSFKINPQQAKDNANIISTANQNNSQINDNYIAAIDTISSNINKIDYALNGTPVQQMIKMVSKEIQAAGVTSHTAGIVNVFNHGNTPAPSISDMAKMYVKATEAVDDYYGNSISYLWEMRNWANNTLAFFDNSVESKLSSALINQLKSAGINYNPADSMATVDGIKFTPAQVARLNNSNSGKIRDVENSLASNMQNFVSTAARRANFIYEEGDANYSGNEESRVTSELNGYLDNHRYTNFAKRYYNLGHNLWFDMNRSGLQKIVSTNISFIDSLKSNYYKLKNSLNKVHEKLTNIEDRIYTTKFNMLTTLYGMLESYETWQTNAVGDTSIRSDIETQKQAIKDEMQVPQITQLYVRKRLDGFNNTVYATWNASHPTGKILDVSYSLKRNGGGSVYGTKPMSADKLSTWHFDAFKEGLNDASHTYSMTIRARGPAGNTVSRLATITVPIAASNGGPGSGSFSRPQNVLSNDKTPPIKPIVGVSYHHTEKKYSGGNMPGTGTRISGFSVGTYWTSINNKIDLKRVLSADPQSDIASFAYAIGKSKGDSDVVGWRDIQGSRVSNGSSGSENRIQKIIINSVILKEGKPYYVSVKAKNGAGLYSSPAELDAIIYDPTPPSAPDSVSNGIKSLNSRFVATYYNPYSSSNSSSAEPEIYSTPKMDSPPTDKAMTKPKAKVQWGGASDDQSGIWGYDYVVNNSPDTAGVFGQISGIPQLQETYFDIIGDPLSYKQAIYVHVRAVNNAGIPGPALTYGPYTAPDESSPSNPKVAAMVTSGSIKLYVIRPSYDLESGIKGAQYAVGTTPGDMDVIKFPESGENLKSTFWLNLPVTEWRNVVKRHTGWNSNINAGYYSISRDNLPAGKKLYISYRTFNKDGKFSGRVVTGPIIIDNTPPLSPVVQITPKINSSSHKVVITLSTSNIYDPESGVEKVVYEVDKKSVKGNWHTSIAWKNLMNITGIKKDKQSSTEFVTVPGKFAYSDMYKVGVRVTNGNGMQRVVWSNPSQIIVNISTINTIGFHGFNH